MLHTLKKYLFLFLLILNINNIYTAENPYIFIDSNAQDMVKVLTSNSNLFESDREAYENKIKQIFEPMIDFRRVSASVMGKKYYLLATKEQRGDFIDIFKDSLLDTYAETLAQWGYSTISTELPDEDSLSKKFASAAVSSLVSLIPWRPGVAVSPTILESCFCNCSKLNL